MVTGGRPGGRPGRRRTALVVGVVVGVVVLALAVTGEAVLRARLTGRLQSRVQAQFHTHASIDLGDRPVLVELAAGRVDRVTLRAARADLCGIGVSDVRATLDGVGATPAGPTGAVDHLTVTATLTGRDLGALAGRIARAAGSGAPPPGLPAGLRVTAVGAGSHGVTVTLAATHVVFGKHGGPACPPPA